MDYTFPVIGIMHCCYMTKFGVPRQPRLIREAAGYIELQEPYNQPNCVRGLEDFSHIWVLFVFHQNIREKWKATVRPPRLGGDKRIGVFASRSSFRPSPIGMSVMELAGIEQKDHGVLRIHVKGMDVVDGTPIIDIKPYIPYSDSIADAKGGYADTVPDECSLDVSVSLQAEKSFKELEKRGVLGLKDLSLRVIGADPRPAYQREEGRVYEVLLSGYEIIWKIVNSVAVITDVRRVPK
ncbi:MAG: tRNA (N6-threonylcarbamoyladenosine(37)-N6)-methyltransferase TrmO [Victivallales bacterium]|nr:tRNA (N6-threonylcarbamoyladenosine(37)-N6)-methyltransferase TrmO [Victivallales bacterium]